MLDYIVVGQGLAGTLLIHFLLKQGKRVQVIDQGHEQAASRVAAGIINPITGRRMVKSWRIDEFLPFAMATYRGIEQQLKAKLLYPTTILRALQNVRQENDWLMRSGAPNVAQYIASSASMSTYQEALHSVHAWGETLQAARVNLTLLIQAYRKYLVQLGCLTEQTFDYQAIKFDATEQIHYQSLTARKIIFCQGAWSQYNPYFEYLPHSPTKGEALIVRIPNQHFEKIIKSGAFIVPLGDEYYWVGSTYVWTFQDNSPTTAGRDELLRRLRQMLKAPFELIEHNAAIRPIFRNRRPVLGLHPEFPQLAIFNGLGTKGASLAPFWANAMCQFLCEGEAIDDEVHLNRF